MTAFPLSSRLPRVAVGAQPRDLQFRGPFVEMFGLVSGHDFSRAVSDLNHSRALQAAEKLKFFEGDGLQAVHKLFDVFRSLLSP